MINKTTKYDNEKIRAALLCYTFSQKDVNENLQELQEFLLTSGIGPVNINDLRDKIDLINKEEEKIKHRQNLMAKLFTQDKKVRSYRLGSDFCPKCHMFKNYEKECPYCKYLEISISVFSFTKSRYDSLKPLIYSCI